MMRKHLYIYAPLVIVLLLSACSTTGPIVADAAPTSPPTDLTNIPDAVPKIEPKSRGGNPASYQVFGKTYHVKPNSLGFTQRGTASWYGTKFHGRKTSNGETYNMYAMSAAHKTLPIPTYLTVTNLANNKQVVVRVNDRGPFHGNRIIDLSYAAATKLDILGHGTAHVEIRAINPKQPVKTSKTIIPIITENTATAIIHKTTTQEPSNVTKLYLQVGAFSDEKNAEKLKLKLLNNNVLIAKINIQHKVESALYRVHIGPYSSLNQADTMRIKLQQVGISNAHYMQY
ncbi:MAG: septal ring lytic transglycosylase RlpA family lipoprotein [Piscirickettsiaceae bacterium]|nr:MAG: septal ring lytic transglycosylase RlpA family lipoprotein [Piscirickettsiaceae bacterium]